MLLGGLRGEETLSYELSSLQCLSRGWTVQRRDGPVLSGLQLDHAEHSSVRCSEPAIYCHV